MRLKQIAIAVDQLGNTLLGGWADETLSARAYRNRFSSNGWRLLYSLINDVFFWMPDHCRAAFESEKSRRQLPAEYRDVGA